MPLNVQPGRVSQNRRIKLTPLSSRYLRIIGQNQLRPRLRPVILTSNAMKAKGTPNEVARLPDDVLSVIESLYEFRVAYAIPPKMVYHCIADMLDWYRRQSAHYLPLTDLSFSRDSDFLELQRIMEDPSAALFNAFNNESVNVFAADGRIASLREEALVSQPIRHFTLAAVRLRHTQSVRLDTLNAVWRSMTRREAEAVLIALRDLPPLEPLAKHICNALFNRAPGAPGTPSPPSPNRAFKEWLELNIERRHQAAFVSLSDAELDGKFPFLPPDPRYEYLLRPRRFDRGPKVAGPG